MNEQTLVAMCKNGPPGSNKVANVAFGISQWWRDLPMARETNLNRVYKMDLESGIGSYEAAKFCKAGSAHFRE